jgi:hypothetical protein
MIFVHAKESFQCCVSWTYFFGCFVFPIANNYTFSTFFVAAKEDMLRILSFLLHGASDFITMYPTRKNVAANVAYTYKSVYAIHFSVTVAGFHRFVL